MFRRLIIAAAFATVIYPSISFSHEFCVRRFQSELEGADTEAANLLIENANLDLEYQKLGTEEDALPALILSALSQVPPNTEVAQQLAERGNQINSRQTAITERAFIIKNRLAQLQGQLPKDLSDKLQDCIEKSAPANAMVNTTLQAIAAFILGPSASFLPEKAIYVDMSEILVGGNILGGPDSVPNEIIEGAKDLGNSILPKCNGCPKF